MSDIETAAGLGHNKPPLVDPETLQAEHYRLWELTEALAQRCETLPKDIESDDQDGAVSAVIADILKVRKAVEKTREGVKEPFLTAGRIVDNIFTRPRDRLDAMSARLNERLTKWKREKERRERAERERIAREAREEADRQAAEARRLEQEAAEAERAGRHAEADVNLNEAVRATETARSAGIDAHLSERQAQAKPAELARTRSGSTLSTLQTFWDFEVLDPGRIDLEALRPFIADEAIGKAIRAAVRAGRRNLGTGVRVFENHKATVRG